MKKHKASKESDKKYYLRNREKIIARARKWRKENKEKCAVIAKRYRAAHKDSHRMSAKKWIAENMDKFKERCKKYREKLPNCYVKSTIRQNSSLKPEDITDEMVQAYRAYIKLKRFLKQQTGANNVTRNNEP